MLSQIHRIEVAGDSSKQSLPIVCKSSGARSPHASGQLRQKMGLEPMNSNRDPLVAMIFGVRSGGDFRHSLIWIHMNKHTSHKGCCRFKKKHASPLFCQHLISCNPLWSNGCHFLFQTWHFPWIHDISNASGLYSRLSTISDLSDFSNLANFHGRRRSLNQMVWNAKRSLIFWSSMKSRNLWTLIWNLLQDSSLERLYSCKI